MTGTSWRRIWEALEALKGVPTKAQIDWAEATFARRDEQEGWMERAMATKTKFDLQEIAKTLAELVAYRVGRKFTQGEAAPETVAEILAVYFQPPTEEQSEADYQTAVLMPVAAALAGALEPWTTSIPLPDVVGAAGCAQVEVGGLAMRVTESRQWDERIDPPPDKVELRAEVGVA